MTNKSKMKCIYENRPVKKTYGMATISRLLKNIGLFCKRALQKRRFSAEESSNFHKVKSYHYGMATISRLLRIVRLFCRILSLL